MARVQMRGASGAPGLLREVRTRLVKLRCGSGWTRLTLWRRGARSSGASQGGAAAVFLGRGAELCENLPLA